MPVTKLDARELMSRGYEMGATVLSGEVQRLEDGTWLVEGQSVETWLSDLEGKEVVIVSAEIAESARNQRTCRTCGTEYTGSECPRCREVHRRLRGR